MSLHRPLVVAVDLNACRPGVRPDETYPPLVIDADTMLPDSIAFHGLKPVTGQAAQAPDVSAALS